MFFEEHVFAIKHAKLRAGIEAGHYEADSRPLKSQIS